MRRLKIAPRSLLAKSTERSNCSRRSARMSGQVSPRLALPRRRGIGQTRLSHGRCWNSGAISSGTSRWSSRVGKMFAQGAERGRQQHGVAEVFELQRRRDFFRPAPAFTTQIAVRKVSGKRRRAGSIPHACRFRQCGPGPAPQSCRRAESSRAGARCKCVVRPFINSSSAACTARSDSVSSALVASSRTRIGAFFKTARAMASRWRWPPESVAPFSPMTVSNPFGFSMMKS